MALAFSTKAGTLAQLVGKLNSARILQLTHFTVDQWIKDRNRYLEQILLELPNSPWIVRSSCKREDNLSNSNAGAFLSITNVKIDTLDAAIDQVIASYGDITEDDEVLVQPMLQNVTAVGVAFSHDPNTCAPYRIINWAEGADTSAITTGVGGHIWQQAAKSHVSPPKRLEKIVILNDELLALFGGAPIDFEYAETHTNDVSELWLLQVRQLILSRPPENEDKQAARLKIVQEKVTRGMQPHPFLVGKRTVYGIMPDWNPAEIIGIRPKPLALSLYRELITDVIWAYQRHNYGYRNLRSCPLMPHFFGLPYIDVRLSFNSFIPADLTDDLAGRLVDHYIDRLLSEPSLHDKVEFEIVFSCYSLDLPERLKSLEASGFTREESESIANSLRNLTNNIIHTENGLWRQDAVKLATLKQRRKQLLDSKADKLERIYWLLEDAKRYGTLPFAGLARAGFVAIQMLKSLVTVGIFSDQDYDAFINGLSTVSGQLKNDLNTVNKLEFLSRYGHLRPGTYDIESTRYDETPDLYFDWSQPTIKSETAEPFSLTIKQMREIAKLLKAHDLKVDPVGLFDFLQAGIELRELAKFDFTRNLSDILTLITEFGSTIGVAKEDLAYSDIAVFKEMHIAALDPKAILFDSIALGKSRHQETTSISLPPIIAHPDDVWSFRWPDSVPNFITQKQITAKVSGCNIRDHLADSIICIPNADPGFDWLFSFPIAGLITAYGGVNSHMAIRAGELGLPAVIGAGEMLYQRWSSARVLFIDCANRKVEIFS